MTDRYGFRSSTLMQRRTNDSSSSDSSSDDPDLFSPVTVIYDGMSRSRTIIQPIPSSKRFKCITLTKDQFKRNNELVKKKLAKLPPDYKDKQRTTRRSTLRSSRRTIPCSAPTVSKNTDDTEGYDPSPPNSSRSISTEENVFDELKKTMDGHQETDVSYEVQLLVGSGALPKGKCLAVEVSPEDLRNAIASKSIKFKNEYVVAPSDTPFKP